MKSPVYQIILSLFDIIQEMSPDAEYLHFNPKVELPEYDELFSSEMVISPKLLVKILEEALLYLTETPGLNISIRQLFSASWIGWWIKYLNTLPITNSDLIPSKKIKTRLSKIKEELFTEHQNNKTSGLLLMGGGEGTEAHRYAQDWVAKFVDLPVLLFEPPEYVNKKSRGGRFLPLSMGVSMWAHYPNTSFIGLIPKNTENVSADIFYQSVHDEAGAQFHFASENDPNCYSKIKRGKLADFCLIPSLDTASTTIRTRKLMDNTKNEPFF